MTLHPRLQEALDAQDVESDDELKAWLESDAGAEGRQLVEIDQALRTMKTEPVDVVQSVLGALDMELPDIGDPLADPVFDDVDASQEVPKFVAAPVPMAAPSNIVDLAAKRRKRLRIATIGGGVLAAAAALLLVVKSGDSMMPMAQEEASASAAVGGLPEPAYAPAPAGGAYPMVEAEESEAAADMPAEAPSVAAPETVQATRAATSGAVNGNVAGEDFGDYERDGDRLAEGAYAPGRSRRSRQRPSRQAPSADMASATTSTMAAAMRASARGLGGAVDDGLAMEELADESPAPPAAEPADQSVTRSEGRRAIECVTGRTELRLRLVARAGTVRSVQVRGAPLTAPQRRCLDSIFVGRPQSETVQQLTLRPPPRD